MAAVMLLFVFFLLLVVLVTIKRPEKFPPGKTCFVEFGFHYVKVVAF